MLHCRLDRYSKAVALGISLFGEEHKAGVLGIVNYVQLSSTEHPSLVVYHDFNHLVAVALRADSFAVSMNLPIEERQTLFLAAMFHDILHSCGNAADIINITTAMYEIQEVCRMDLYPFIAHINVEQISHAIMCTIFPFKIRPTSDIECCLRDADLCMSLEEDADMFALGLQNELANKGETVNVTVESMMEFAKLQRFYTIECAQLFGFNHAYRFKTDKPKTQE